MISAVSHQSTFCFNRNNHPSIPEEGLVLEAGVRTPVTPEQAEYLRDLGLEVQDDLKPPRARRATQE